MTDPTVVIPLLLALGLAIAVVLFVRRASGALRVSRQVERFQHEAEALGSRIDALLGTFIGRVDQVRRRDLDAIDILEEAHGTRDQLEQGWNEALAIETPPAFAVSHQGMVAELERAMRATEMVIHGCELATGPQHRERGQEAQTAVKRGYLNLLHAREALGEHVTDLARARDPAARRWRTSRV